MRCENEICLFLHIPKAAGTTLQTILWRNFPSNLTWVIDPNRGETSIDNFRRQPDCIRRRFRAFRGHMPFGTHQLLTTPSTYVTLLRHPVDRMISHYYYVKQCGPSHYLYQQVRENNYSLAEYARSGISSELDNGQVRLLTDTEDSVPIGGMTREHLEQAKENLARYFGVVGTVDRFDEFLMMLRRRFNLPHIEYDRENVTRVRPRLKDLADQDREAILKSNRLDEELYQFAEQLMDSQIQAYGPLLQRDLREFHWRQWRRRQLAKITPPLKAAYHLLRRGLGKGIRQMRDLSGATKESGHGLTPVASLSSGEFPCYREPNDTARS